MTRRRPPRSRFSRPQWAISIAAALAAIGFVGAAQWNSSLARQEYISSAQRVLIIEAEQAQRQQESLRSQLEEAEARVRTFQERDEGSRTALEALNQELVFARFAAGLEAVRGPGVIIEIADSERPVPAGESPTNYIVLVDDLRDIITALWGSGAEAVSIAGGAVEGGPLAERLVTTTSIYGAGAAILVNDVRLSPPYRIEAIGAEGLNDRFLAHPSYLARVARRIESYGLQFITESRDELELPAFVGAPPLRWGAPVAELD